MKSFLVGLLALVAISFAAVDNAHAQKALFKNQTPGALIKSATGGIADEATTGTATSTSAAATLNTDSGTVTTEALTTAGLADYTFTLTNSKITTASKVFYALTNGTNTQGTLAVGPATKASGSSVVLIHNLHATQALNGTIKIQFWVVQ